MKKILFSALLCLSTMMVASRSYVDLGLPSGTLWCSENERGYYTYDKAVSTFGNKLPTKKQYAELISNCQWRWYGSGYRVIGRNGQSIDLPANGYMEYDGSIYFSGTYGSYWSSSMRTPECPWSLRFGLDANSKPTKVEMGSGGGYAGYNVRIVR